MIIDVIPTTKLPRSLSVLSYKLPPPMEGKAKIGALITVPLRHSLVEGVIYRIHNQKLPYPLKYVLNSPNSKVVFTKNQLDLFMELAKYYQVSASLFVHFNLPKLINKDWPKLPMDEIKIKTQTAKKSQYIWWPNIAGRNKKYLSLISKTKKSNQQILLLVPTVQDIDNLAKSLKLKSTSYTPIHGQLSRAAHFKTWLKALGQMPARRIGGPARRSFSEGGSNVFIGTRSAIFYPFTNLEKIIIDEENSPDHKHWDMNPRYDARLVSQKISELQGVQIIYSSYSPSLISYQNFKLKNSTPKTNYKIITPDLNDEIEVKNYTLLSDKLITNIESVLKEKKRVFLLSGKKGESSNTACNFCGFVFTCPNCQLPLVKNADNTLVCHHCEHKENFPPFCPKCGTDSFKSSGLGIQKTEAHLKKLLPKAKITRLDKDSNSTNLNSNDIIIGTVFALNKIDWSKVGLIGVINADFLWQHPEFMSTANAFSTFVKILTFAPKNTIIIIQTFSPEHCIIKSISRNQPAIFYNQELNIRQTFHYPPFYNLVKISFSNKNKAKATKIINQIYNKLNKQADKSIIISAPLPILRQKLRGKYKFNIIIKIKNLTKLNHLIKGIPNDAIIDVEPITLLD